MEHPVEVDVTALQQPSEGAYASLEFLYRDGLQAPATVKNIPRYYYLPPAAHSFDFGLLRAALALIPAAWRLVPMELFLLAYARERLFST